LFARLFKYCTHIISEPQAIFNREIQLLPAGTNERVMLLPFRLSPIACLLGKNNPSDKSALNERVAAGAEAEQDP
jgi:hypothetical protein